MEPVAQVYKVFRSQESFHMKLEDQWGFGRIPLMDSISPKLALGLQLQRAGSFREAEAGDGMKTNAVRLLEEMGVAWVLNP